MKESAENRICSITVMDTTTSLIRFDDTGVSNFVHEFNDIASKTIFREEAALKLELEALVSSVKKFRSPQGYNCILGLSGGVDSSFLAIFCKMHGINPLCVHFDNGWNTEAAVNNIHAVIQTLGFDLQTFVMDWEEFKDIQLAYFKASVLDLEVPTDQFIFGALNKIAEQQGIKYILSGNNIATEFVIPSDWKYDKFDWVNLKAIHKKFGKGKLSKLPPFGKKHMHYYRLVAGIETLYPLNLIRYRKKDAIQLISSKINWKHYGDKHQESIFTRWYQGCYLPLKFNIDKRKAHLSNLILNIEMTRDEALKLLEKPAYSPAAQAEDRKFVAKKWGITEHEFDSYLFAPPRSHDVFPNDKSAFQHYKLLAYKKIFTAPLKLLNSRKKNKLKS